ncbi:MAG: S41 family peptidase [Gemmatimonadales bacterium]
MMLGRLTRRVRALRATIVFSLLALPAFAAGCTDSLVGPAATSNNGALFDELWHDVDRHYPFLEYKHLNWDSLGAVYRPRAVAAAGDAALAAVLGGLLVELRDPHVSLSPAGQPAIRYITPFAALFDPEATLQQYVSSAARTPGDHVVYGEVAPGVGYVRIASFLGAGWSDEIDGALAALAERGANTAVVIDLRGNLGGDRATAVAVAGRFADRERTFGYLRFRNGAQHGDFTPYAAERVAPEGARRFAGPTYLLTDRHVMSAAEEFVLALRATPTATVVGDTTGGASGGPVTRELSNGWTYELSQWIECTASGSVYENVGLPPDVAVAADSAIARRESDPALERAIALAEGRIRVAVERRTISLW